MVGGSGGEQPPTAKTSAFAHFRGWWLVEVQGGGGGHWWVVVVSNGRPWCKTGGHGVKQEAMVSTEGGGGQKAPLSRVRVRVRE